MVALSAVRILIGTSLVIQATLIVIWPDGSHRIAESFGSAKLLLDEFVFVPPLRVFNIPSVLTWNAASREGGPKGAVVPVDYSYVYNPSILELENGRHLFAARMSWLYSGDCHLYANLIRYAPQAMYNCLRTHMSTFTDQTVIGTYYAERLGEGQLHVENGTTSPGSLGNTDVSVWNDGPGWFDTRLVYPYNHRFLGGRGSGDSDNNGDKIIMTSQNTELLGNADWDEIWNDSTLALQLTYIGTFDPHPTSGSHHHVRNNKMVRWLFYDSDIEHHEQERRRNGLKWTPISADVARLKCMQRPAHLEPLPFDVTKSPPQMLQSIVPTTDFYPQENAQKLVNHEDRNPQWQQRRRLAALEGNEWFTIKDKNWTPFSYKNSLLWSHSIEPHVVCENDVDIYHVGSEEIDCILCIKKYKSNSSDVFAELHARIQSQGFQKAIPHLNGAPSYYLEAIDSYLGIMHVKKTNQSTDAVGKSTTHVVYEHYFYMTEANPPFRVTNIAQRRVPLKRSRCWSPWFEVGENVVVEFVMYMQYHPDRPGHEIALSYGDGDRHARYETFGLKEVLGMFGPLAGAI